MAGTASAADIYAPARADPLYALPNTWSGFYVGAALGYSWNRLTVNDRDYWDGLGDNSQSNDGVAVGGTIGYNVQRGALVYGIEADLSYLSNEGSRDNDNTTGSPYALIKSKLDALGTVRGRAGIALDPALLYVTAGLALGNVENSYSDLHNTENPGRWKSNGWQTGWVAGAGIESQLSPNWSWKVEGLYYQLSDDTSTYRETGEEGRAFRQEFSDAGFIARFGLNYHTATAYVPLK